MTERPRGPRLVAYLIEEPGEALDATFDRIASDDPVRRWMWTSDDAVGAVPNAGIAAVVAVFERLATDAA